MIVARSIMAFTVFLVGGLIFTACGTGERPIAVTPSSQPAITVIPGGDDVTSEVALQDDELLIDINSESGIGSATIVIPDESRPAKVILRMHLSGLEQLQMAYDDLVIQASVDSTPPYNVRQRVREEEGELVIDDTSPYWMDIALVSGDAEVPAKIPLEDGYFEVDVPENFLMGGYEEITLSWIDFYR